MNREDVAELDLLLARHREAKTPWQKGHTRKTLETALVKHADGLIAAAKVVSDWTSGIVRDEPIPDVPDVGER
jgi:hypothetical protein